MRSVIKEPCRQWFSSRPVNQSCSFDRDLRENGILLFQSSGITSYLFDVRVVVHPFSPSEVWLVVSP